MGGFLGDWWDEWSGGVGKALSTNPLTAPLVAFGEAAPYIGKFIEGEYAPESLHSTKMKAERAEEDARLRSIANARQSAMSGDAERNLKGLAFQEGLQARNARAAEADMLRMLERQAMDRNQPGWAPWEAPSYLAGGEPATNQQYDSDILDWAARMGISDEIAAMTGGTVPWETGSQGTGSADTGGGYDPMSTINAWAEDRKGDYKDKFDRSNQFWQDEQTRRGNEIVADMETWKGQHARSNADRLAMEAFYAAQHEKSVGGMQSLYADQVRAAEAKATELGLNPDAWIDAVGATEAAFLQGTFDTGVNFANRLSVIGQLAWDKVGSDALQGANAEVRRLNAETAKAMFDAQDQYEDSLMAIEDAVLQRQISVEDAAAAESKARAQATQTAQLADALGQELYGLSPGMGEAASLAGILETVLGDAMDVASSAGDQPLVPYTDETIGQTLNLTVDQLLKRLGQIDDKQEAPQLFDIGAESAAELGVEQFLSMEQIEALSKIATILNKNAMPRG